MYGLLYSNGAFAVLEWGCLTQKTVSLSTAEAELRAAVDGLRSLLTSLPLLRRMAGSPRLDSTTRHGDSATGESSTSTTAELYDFDVCVDAQAAIDAIAKGASNKMQFTTGPARKHAQVHLSWLHQVLFEEPTAANAATPCCKVASRDNVADIFTKAVDAVTFARHRFRLGVMSMQDALAGPAAELPEQAAAEPAARAVSAGVMSTSGSRGRVSLAMRRSSPRSRSRPRSCDPTLPGGTAYRFAADLRVQAKDPRIRDICDRVERTTRSLRSQRA